MYTIQEAKNILKDGIEIYLQKNEKGEYMMNEVNRLPFYLEGPPGIGKTEIVRQVADELGIGYVSFSLTHHTRNSLLGLPVIRDLEDGKYTEYTMSEIIARVLQEKESGSGEGVLLLDEFACVSDGIMPAMLAFLQTKNIGMHTLPSGWIIVLCGNPPQYNRNSRQFDASVLDRLRMISVDFDAQVFLSYAEEHDIHRDICSYLRLKPDNVYRCINDGKNHQLVTCRGWENLSHAIYGMEGLGKNIDEKLVGQFIKSAEIMHDFFCYYNMNRVGICEKDLKSVLGGKNIDRYVEKYADKDISIWWNAVDVFADFIKNEHSDFGEEISMMKLAGNILGQLRKTKNINSQIENRLYGNTGMYLSVMIPMWDSNKNTYTECSDLERELLSEWKDMVDNCCDCINVEEDKVWISEIENWKKERQNDEKKEIAVISKEVSNVFQFLRGKDDILTEKFYQVINHSELLLYVMTKARNRDYLDLCKKNYAVG